MSFLAAEAMTSNKKFGWQQRLALIRHNLHTSSLSQDFTFFKTLQALNLISGIDYLANLTSTLSSTSNSSDDDNEDMADSLILSLDKFNTVVACVHEDAFKSLYETVRACAGDKQKSRSERKALYYASMAAERKKAAEAIDKMFNSASDAISGQPQVAQEEAARVFTVGTSFVADAIEICLSHMDKIEACLDDPFRLDASWSTVESAVATATSGMKGVFKLMDQSEPATPKTAPLARSRSHEQYLAEGPENRGPSRAQSVDGYAKSMLRRMSTAFAGAPSLPSSTSPSHAGSSTLPSRKASIASSFVSAPSRKSSVASSASYTASSGSSNSGHSRTRNISSASLSGFAHSMPSSSSFTNAHSGLTKAMSPIPGTPGSGGVNTKVNPFDATFANNVAFDSNWNSQDQSATSINHRNLLDDDDDDICPTTPTAESYSTMPAASTSSAPYHTIGMIDHEPQSKVPTSRKSSTASIRSARSPLRQTSSARENALAALSGTPAWGSSRTASVPTASSNVAMPMGPTVAFAAGLRRRSVNVSGERPELEGLGRAVYGDVAFGTRTGDEAA